MNEGARNLSFLSSSALPFDCSFPINFFITLFQYFSTQRLVPESLRAKVQSCEAKWLEKKKMTFTSKQDSSKAACFVSRNIRMEKYRSKSNLEMDWHTVSLQSSSFELLCINRSMEIVDTYLRRLIDWKICIDPLQY